MRVFVSYNTRDENAVEGVVRRLTAARPETEVYYAPEANTAGAYWVARLGEEVAASDVMLLFLGRRVGAWQELEYYEALRQARKSGRPRIIPLLLEEDAPGLYFLGQLHRLRVAAHPPLELVELIARAIEDAGRPEDAEPLWRQTNPYRGLFSVGTTGAAYFFGRETLTTDILERLRTRRDRIQMLVGNSGVGKSSLAQAGVIASLRSKLWPNDLDRDWPADLDDAPAWLTVSFAPGEHPLRALALAFARTWIESPAEREAEAIAWAQNFQNGSSLAALAAAAAEKLAERTDAPAPPRVLIYVDQAEELYGRAEASEAALFSRLLAEAVARPEITILASLRSDYYGRLQADEPLFAASDRIDIPPLDREQIETVIRKPVALLGARFETPEIVPMIAEATVREPGSMPLLSYMMSAAWEEMRRDATSDGVLRFALGVVDVARPLVDRAERFVETHPAKLDWLRRLFTLRLAHVPKEGEPVRRRAARAECSAEEWALAEELAGSDWRLLSTGEKEAGPVAEVAHEALLRKWPRLQRWLDEARGFLIWKGQLEAARREWEAAPDDCKDSAVLMGLALETARRWMVERGNDLPPEDRAFVERSEEIDSQRKAEEARREQELARRRSWIVRLSIAAALIFAIFGGIAGWQWSEARENLKLANERRAELVDALEREEVARTEAEAAANRAAQERNRAESALQRAEAELRKALIEQARVRAAAAEDLLAEDRPDHALAVATAAFPEEQRELWRILDEQSEVSRFLVRAATDASVIATLRGHESLRSAAWSPAGDRIVTASSDGTARVWDAATGEELRALRGHEHRVQSAAWSPAGDRIVTASDDGTARVWPVETLEAMVDRLKERVEQAAILSPEEECAFYLRSEGC